MRPMDGGKARDFGLGIVCTIVTGTVGWAFFWYSNGIELQSSSWDAFTGTN